MPGLDGAIEDVRDRDDGTFQLGVIGGGAPEGICGSGLVDLMSELLRTGPHERDGPLRGWRRDRIDVDAAHEIYFTESDVNELAQAKGANVAGLQVIFNQYGIAFDESTCSISPAVSGGT